MIALLLADRENLVVNVVPTPLLEMSRDILRYKTLLQESGPFKYRRSWVLFEFWKSSSQTEVGMEVTFSVSPTQARACSTTDNGERCRDG